MEKTRRNRRYAIRTNGRYRKGTGVRFDVAINDLSAHGCQFSDLVGALQPSDEITIRIGDIGPIPATVQWTEKRRAGLEFIEPLHISVLDHIILRGGRNEAA